SFAAWSNPNFYAQCWVSQESILQDGQYWRLLTALFLHADITHLAANGPLLLIFAYILEAYFGNIAFPVASFLVGIASNFVTVMFYSPHTHLVGASGMAYGMV